MILLGLRSITIHLRATSQATLGKMRRDRLALLLAFVAALSCLVPAHGGSLGTVGKPSPRSGDPVLGDENILRLPFFFACRG